MRIATFLAAAASLCFLPTLHASIFYPTTDSIAFPQTGQVVTADAEGYIVSYTFVATNIGTQTLDNIYVFTSDLSLNSDAATLVSPGDYQVAGTALYADATNNVVVITPSETNDSLDSDSSGSAIVPEIPGFLIADSLAPGQSVDAVIDFQIPTGVSYLGYGGFITADVAPTPEPSSIVLIGTGLMGIAGVMRKRFA